MNRKEYNLLLQDKKWLDRRRTILIRDNQCCKSCKSKKKLQIHHLFYIKNHMPWDYDDNCLKTLCNRCHKNWHKNHKVVVFDETPIIEGKKTYIAPYKEPTSAPSPFKKHTKVNLKIRKDNRISDKERFLVRSRKRKLKNKE